MLKYIKKDWAKTRRRQLETKRLEEEKLQKLDDVVKNAQNCLRSPAFQKYRQALAGLEKITLERIKRHPVNDPEYARVCAVSLREIELLQQLLYKVEKDARDEKK